MRICCFLSGPIIVGIATMSLSPMAAWAQGTNGVGQFELSTRNDPETLAFTRAHELLVCNRTEQHPINLESQLPPWEVLAESPARASRSPATALNVSYRGSTRRLEPGQCDLLRAATVQIGSASALSATSTLPGTVRDVIPGRVLRAEMASDTLAAQLQRADQTTRAGTAELNRARRTLVRATHALDATQRLEARVWRDERNAGHTEESALSSAERSIG